jgi:hypothetical protein
MNCYDDDMMIELIACGELSHAKIAEKVGVSRQTVWQIASGQSRPELQWKITAAADGIRQAAIRHAGRFTEALLEKQAEVALGDGETARKAREFLLKMLLITLPDQAAKKRKDEPEPKPKSTCMDSVAFHRRLTDKLNYQIGKHLGYASGTFSFGIDESSRYFDEAGKYIGPPVKDYPGDPNHPDLKLMKPEYLAAGWSPAPPERPDEKPDEKPADKKPAEKPDEKPAEKPADKPDKKPDKKPRGRQIKDPFLQYVMGPFGVKVLKKSLEIEREELEELRKNPPNPRPPRVEYPDYDIRPYL